jgi:hypothetical protein
MKKFFAVACLQLLSFFSHAQLFAERDYPADYFRYPLNIPMRLNANFGEMRPNHFHMGIDLFTEKRENLPVFAVAEGWVSRIKIDPTGFGNAIYLSHPNGYTTLYAHMNTFAPFMLELLETGQYANESWKGDVDFEVNELKVKKGDFIGYSGNTGASAGPHVHYEIRRTDDDACLNPLFFHPVKDATPPVISKIAIYDRNKSTYEQSPKIILPIKSGNEYVTQGGIITVNSSRISVAIVATDAITGVPNQNGIYEAVVYLDDIPVSGFLMDDIGYQQTRYLNAHIDYRLQAGSGSYFQHLTPLPGDRLPIYYRKKDGVLELDNDEHQLKIQVKDPNGNKSVFRCKIRLAQPLSASSNPEKDSRYMLPNQINVFEAEGIQLVTTEKAFYDAFKFVYGSKTSLSGLSRVHILHHQSIPVHDSMTIRIMPQKPLNEQQAKRVVMIREGKGKKEFRRTTEVKGWYEAKYRDFGEFRLELDEQAPVIQISGLSEGFTIKKGHVITCTVTDNLEKIYSFRAEIDGKWVMFTGIGPVYRYSVDEHCSTGKHILKIIAEDVAGNSITNEISFNRE